MNTAEYIEYILTDRAAHSDWVKKCKEKGYSGSKIESLNDAMINVSGILKSGRKLELQNDRVWLGYSIDKGEDITVPLKDNESVEIYLGKLGYCQIRVVDGEPVQIVKFGEGSERETKAKEVYGI